MDQGSAANRKRAKESKNMDKAGNDAADKSHQLLSIQNKQTNRAAPVSTRKTPAKKKAVKKAPAETKVAKKAAATKAPAIKAAKKAPAKKKSQ